LAWRWGQTRPFYLPLTTGWVYQLTNKDVTQRFMRGIEPDYPLENHSVVKPK
jgi:hypothetical protein